jgi:response regulator RpfG family c-di-GMP phosphodiesterase
MSRQAVGGVLQPDVDRDGASGEGNNPTTGGIGCRRQNSYPQPVAEFLRMAGFKVVEMANAAEPVEVFVVGTMIHLVFSDIEMLGPMDGIRLARRISHHHPGIPVILTSSINHTARTTETAAQPYRLAEAAGRIRSLLEDPQ